MLFLQVIGDKKAAMASEILLQRQGRDSLRKLEDKLGAQLKFIHVIRNPFDNIATMALRIADLKKNKPQDDLKVSFYCINEVKLFLKLFSGYFKCRGHLKTVSLALVSLIK